MPKLFDRTLRHGIRVQRRTNPEEALDYVAISRHDDAITVSIEDVPELLAAIDAADDCGAAIRRCEAYNSTVGQIGAWLAIQPGLPPGFAKRFLDSFIDSAAE